MQMIMPFLTTYGVKQGGCMSPDLYKWYEEMIAITITKLYAGVANGMPTASF